jgi:hypothetical protein
MNCPKCGASNPDGAEYCSLCCEFFKKAKAAGGVPVLAFDHVDANVNDWTASGPLMVREDGFYFFVEQFFDRDRAVARAAAGGLVGALAIAAAEKLEGEPQMPPGIELKPSERIAELFQPALGAAPKIAACKQYFLVARGDMKKLWFDFIGQLCVETALLKLRIHGASPKDKTSGFLVMRGYPVER